MKKSLVLICASALSIFAFGCKGTEEVNCTENPSERACVEACTVDPTLSHCTDTDAGPDTGVSDGGVDVDTGPESPCEEECTGETSLCNETTMLCVQCIEAEDCEGMGVNTMCSDAGMCVQCLGNADCTEPVASVCSTDEATAGTCVACAAATSDVDCAGVVDGETALNVCDESGESPTCVQCNGGDETACGDFVCDVLAQTCTDDVGVGTANACEPCLSDLQCEAGHACVPVGTEEPRMFYCLKDSAAAGGCAEPFTTPRSDRTSINGTEDVIFCGINETLASCENVRSLLDNVACPSGTDVECPEGGLCRTVGLLMNRCTYECTGGAQCDRAGNPGAFCDSETNMNIGPDYCGGRLPE